MLLLRMESRETWQGQAFLVCCADPSRWGPEAGLAFADPSPSPLSACGTVRVTQRESPASRWSGEKGTLLVMEQCWKVGPGDPVMYG